MMSIIARTFGGVFASLVAATGSAHAQVAPVQYWIPGAFGGSSTVGVSAESWRNVPGFDAAARDNGVDWRDAVPTGPFIRSQSASWSGLGATSFGNFSTLSITSTQAGSTFKGLGDLPVTLYAGFDALSATPALGNPLVGSTGGYNAHAGIALQPAPNVSLSLEAGFAQSQTGGIDSDIRSRRLPGETPIFIGR
jgi:hypothetical protein